MLRFRESPLQIRMTPLSDLLVFALGSREISNLHNQAVKYLPLRLGISLSWATSLHEDQPSWKWLWEKKTFADSEKDTHRDRQRARLWKKERERERKYVFLLVSCCITDVLRSCGLLSLSHVVVRDVSLSLPGLWHCQFSHSRKYVPAKAHSVAKIKKDRRECNYAELSRKKCLFKEIYSH